MSMKSPSAVYICADSGVPVFGEKGCSVHVQEMLGAFLEEGLDMRLIAQRLGGVPGEQIARARLSVLPPLAAPDVAGRETSALLANRDQEAILPLGRTRNEVPSLSEGGRHQRAPVPILQALGHRSALAAAGRGVVRVGHPAAVWDRGR
jgi:hypothetical protein